MSEHVDELEIIARITQRFGTRPAGGLGIGDDAAVLAGSGARALTVDAAIEGVHFRRDFGSLEGLAARAFEAAASDLAAMGARFEAALLSFELPSHIDESEVEAILEGFASAAERAGGFIAGGNVAKGDRLAFHTTAVGQPLGAPLTRAGARLGDSIFVSGPTGAAAAGLTLLLRGAHEPRALIDAFLGVRARFDVSRAVAERAHAAIDLSDGLLLDLTRLAEASSVLASIEVSRLPEHPAERSLEGQLDLEELRLTGGESYELLVTGPPELEGVAGLVRVGAIEEGRGVRLVDEDGRPRPLPAVRGHVHR